MVLNPVFSKLRKGFHFLFEKPNRKTSQKRRKVLRYTINPNFKVASVEAIGQKACEII